MRFIYTLLFYLLLPIILIRLLWRSLAAPAYAKRWAERFGLFPALTIDKSTTSKKVVWLHTVSVGEFLGALPLIRRLQADESLQLVITTTTPTGSERVRSTLGDSVFHVYAPYDLPDSLSRFLQRVKPSIYLVMETELWPNSLALCARHKIPSLLINARLSEKSAKGYARFSWLTQAMLSNLSLVAAQYPADAERFKELGLPDSRCLVTGNIKFDITITDELREKAQQLKQHLSEQGKYKIFIAASTHQGEDEIIVEVFKKLIAENTPMRLILVPRHPERFDTVFRLCCDAGFKTTRRSHGELPNDIQILLGDTMGELMLLYGASDMAFVGGSLVPNGGHNFIEAAAWGLPLLSGEHLFNFAEISRLLMDAGALKTVNSSDGLFSEIQTLINNLDECEVSGAAGLRVVKQNRGALEKTLKVITSHIARD
jgi:3-deoxy-D-manno-octulosonic-acid transferase